MFYCKNPTLLSNKNSCLIFAIYITTCCKNPCLFAKRRESMHNERASSSRYPRERDSSGQKSNGRLSIFGNHQRQRYFVCPVSGGDGGELSGRMREGENKYRSGQSSRPPYIETPPLLALRGCQGNRKSSPDSMLLLNQFPFRHRQIDGVVVPCLVIIKP